MATLASAPSRQASVAPVTATRHIALAGNPNAGKTTLFNALTGMRQKVGNYPGVTVEKKEGRCQLPGAGEAVLLDLPGTYSLAPKSPDEEIARDILLGFRPDTPRPDAVVVVVDASNLERNLYLATQILELGLPTVIALNMTDIAGASGRPVDAGQLSEDLGAPVIEMIAVRGQGLDQLRAVLAKAIAPPNPPELHLPDDLEAARTRLASALDPAPQDGVEVTATAGPRGVALRLLCSDLPARVVQEQFGPVVAETLAEARAASGYTPAAASATEAQARYAALGAVVERAVQRTSGELPHSFTDRADAILTHRVWGLAIFAVITLLVFQAIFSWASYPMDLIDNGVAWLGDQFSTRMAEGPLRDLLVEGIIAGIGAVIIFLPQILILFFFIGLLEDSGYMARAAFLMDRLMARVGLHGRAFIPLMSSFACAIPGIMATRTIASRRDRMTTILIAPLMACSARLPVYTLMIATFIPAQKIGGILSLRAAVMFSLYVLGVLGAMAAAWIFKKTLFKGPPPPLMLELPPYKIPAWRNVIVTMWERGSQFLKRAGTVILAISIVLWFLLSYPKTDPALLDAPDVAPPAGVRP
ncbi:MAG: ferrous iron transport protein B, partial [Armatimonadota bacterium]|nr:ferrous iron transport protein B [Armatimonadota bacterium]